MFNYDEIYMTGTTTQNDEELFSQLINIGLRWQIMIKMFEQKFDPNNSIEKLDEAVPILRDMKNLSSILYTTLSSDKQGKRKNKIMKVYPMDSEKKLFLDYTPKDLSKDFVYFSPVNTRMLNNLRLIHNRLLQEGSEIIITCGPFYSNRNSNKRWHQHNEMKAYDFKAKDMPMERLAEILREMGGKKLINGVYKLRGEYFHYSSTVTQFRVSTTNRGRQKTMSYQSCYDEMYKLK